MTFINDRKFFLSVALMIIFGLLFNYRNTGTETNLKPIEGVGEADYFLRQVKISQFDHQGTINNQLSAKKLEHFTGKALSLLEMPELVSHPQSMRSWRINAVRGELTQDRNNLLLLGDVRIQEENQSEGKITAQISANSLNLDLTQNRAVSDDEIVMTTQSSQTIGTGLEIDFGTQSISIQQDVSTQMFKF